MEDTIQTTEEITEKPKRPQMLTTLCVLSFIMCGLSVLMGLYDIYQKQPEVMQNTIEQVRAMNPEMADQMENNMIDMQENVLAKIYPYINLVFVLLSFLGVVMMWNLNKTGFYLYSIAEILPYSGFIIMRNANVQIPGMSSDAAAKMLIMVMVITILIDVLFVWLYSRNIKHMRS